MLSRESFDRMAVGDVTIAGVACPPNVNDSCSTRHPPTRGQKKLLMTMINFSGET